MKRIIGLLICAFLFTGIQILINCSSPLESEDLGQLDPPPPGGIDTVFILDTIIIVEPDTSQGVRICTQMNKRLKNIGFRFPKLLTPYLLEFEAMANANFPASSIRIHIDGKKYTWKLNETNRFSVILDSPKKKTDIKLKPNKSLKIGQSLDICLEITAT